MLNDKYISSFAKAHNNKNIDWKIKVRGTLKGKQLINNNVIDYNNDGIWIYNSESGYVSYWHNGKSKIKIV